MTFFEKSRLLVANKVYKCFSITIVDKRQPKSRFLKRIFFLVTATISTGPSKSGQNSSGQISSDTFEKWKSYFFQSFFGLFFFFFFFFFFYFLASRITFVVASAVAKMR